jgi:hypothetical protein
MKVFQRVTKNREERQKWLLGGTVVDGTFRTLSLVCDGVTGASCFCLGLALVGPALSRVVFLSYLPGADPVWFIHGWVAGQAFGYVSEALITARVGKNKLLSQRATWVCVCAILLILGFVPLAELPAASGSSFTSAWLIFVIAGIMLAVSRIGAATTGVATENFHRRTTRDSQPMARNGP